MKNITQQDNKLTEIKDDDLLTLDSILENYCKSCNPLKKDSKCHDNCTYLRINNLLKDYDNNINEE